MSSTKTVPRYLRVKEVAEITNIPTWSLYELIRSGKGPPVSRIGSRIRIADRALMEWMDQQRDEAYTNQHEEGDDA